jgi:glycolate oxidase iron-sulfur subunit
LPKIEASGVEIRVGFQDSCHLRNGLGVFKEPRILLKQISDYVEIPNASGCCGAAGTYSLLQKKNSRRVVAQKVVDIKELNLDYVATVNPGCTRQLAGALKRAGLKTRVVHISELVKLAKG